MASVRQAHTDFRTGGSARIEEREIGRAEEGQMAWEGEFGQTRNFEQILQNSCLSLQSQPFQGTRF